MKFCNKCKENKDLLCFNRDKTRPDGYSYYCKNCIAIFRENELRKKGITKKEYNHRMYLKFREDALVYGKNKYYDNREERLNYQNEYYKKNREQIKERRKNHKIKKTVKFRICAILRARINKVLKGISKSGSAVRDLGCSIEEFKLYIESKFQPGMSWENYGFYGWHIDHIKPLYLFDLNNPYEFKKAVHYTNLQPLWARDNLMKGRKFLDQIK